MTKANQIVGPIVAVIALSVAAYFIFQGNQPSVVVGDPAGTVTTELRYDIAGQSCINFETGTLAAGGENYDMRLESSCNFHTFDITNIADVGVVSSLGYITSIPTSGWVTTCSAVKNHGYVVKTVEGRYYRMRVSDHILSAGITTEGGVVGFTIKWASL